MIKKDILLDSLYNTEGIADMRQRELLFSYIKMKDTWK